MDEELAPWDRRRERAHLPQMDRCRTPVFTVARVRKAERDCEAQKPSPFGPRNDGELPRRHLRASEVEHPRDPAVAQGMDLIRIAYVAHRVLRLGPYSTQAFQASGQRCSTFCRDLTDGPRRVSGRHDTMRECDTRIDFRPDVCRLAGVAPTARVARGPGGRRPNQVGEQG